MDWICEYSYGWLLDRYAHNFVACLFTYGDFILDTALINILLPSSS